MTLKGMYNPEETYNPGDVVLLDGSEFAYCLNHPAQAGVPPTDTNFWNRLSPELSDCAQMIVSYQAPKTTRKK